MDKKEKTKVAMGEIVDGKMTKGVVVDIPTDLERTQNNEKDQDER